uniref:DNA polymerase delta subunit 4 n=1 Tax=Oncorhynchus mykiss TaxID=8022 RepID=A0A8C7QNW5_ONCMY
EICRSAPEQVQSHDELRPLTAREKELQELRQFDQDWRCGPCSISRLQRWERAAQHGLNPPREIRYMPFSADTDYTHCLSSDYPL